MQRQIPATPTCNKFVQQHCCIFESNVASAGALRLLAGALNCYAVRAVMAKTTPFCFVLLNYGNNQHLYYTKQTVALALFCSLVDKLLLFLFKLEYVYLICS